MEHSCKNYWTESVAISVSQLYPPITRVEAGSRKGYSAYRWVLEEATPAEIMQCLGLYENAEYRCNRLGVSSIDPIEENKTRQSSENQNDNHVLPIPDFYNVFPYSPRQKASLSVDGSAGTLGNKYFAQSKVRSLTKLPWDYVLRLKRCNGNTRE